MLDKLRSRLVHFGPSLMSVPVKLAPFALKRQVLEQVLSWQFAVVVDYNEIIDHPSDKCSIHLRETPQGVRNARLKMTQVDYLIEEQ